MNVKSLISILLLTMYCATLISMDLIDPLEHETTEPEQVREFWSSVFWTSAMYSYSPELECRALQGLIESDTDLNMYTTIERRTTIPLILCVEHNYHDFIDILLAKGALIDIQSSDGNTPLHLAAQQNCERSVKLLLQRGAQTQIRNEAGNTPLHLAVQYNHEAIIRLLLQHGSKIDTPNNKYETSLSIATKKGCFSIVKLLINSVEQSSPHEFICLLVALEHKQDDIAEFFIKRSADINSTYYFDTLTPLHRAIVHNRTRIIILLLHKGANVNAQDDCGRAPLHYAARKKQKRELLTLLLRYGGDMLLRTSDPTHVTPLDLYCRFITDQTSRSLFNNYFANRSACNAIPALSLEQCKSLSTVAFYFRDLPIIKKIIASLREIYPHELKEIINQSLDENDSTLLIHAIQHHDMELCSELLDPTLTISNADESRTPVVAIDKRNRHGFNAFHYAILRNIDWLASLNTKESTLLRSALKKCIVLAKKQLAHMDCGFNIVTSAEQLSQLEQFSQSVMSVKEELDQLNSFGRSLGKDKRYNIHFVIRLLRLAGVLSEFKYIHNLRINIPLLNRLIAAGGTITSDIIALAAAVDYYQGTRLLFMKLCHHCLTPVY